MYREREIKHKQDDACWIYAVEIENYGRKYEGSKFWTLNNINLNICVFSYFIGEVLQMFEVWEIFRRAKTGETMKERDFDMKLTRKVAESIKEYDIRFNKEEIITTDNSLVDDVYRAAIDLTLDIGVYVLDTQRIIKFDENEIKEAVKTAPSQIIVGEGKDARILKQRKVEDPSPPLIIGGDAGAPVDDELYFKMALSYLKEPIIDIVDHASIVKVHGINVESGTFLEAYAARREMKLIREAARLTGRPGIHIIGGESSTTLMGDIAIMSQEYLRPTDAHLIPVLNEMKTNYDNLGRVISSLEYGALNVGLPDPIIGGFARGPEGVAIVHVAEFLMGRLVYFADYHIGHPVHMFLGSTSAPECLWVISTISQSVARNTNFIITGNVWPSAGAGTEMIFDEIVANTLVATVTGAHPLGVTGTNGKLPHATGLETRFMGEVAHAASKSKLKREDANEVVLYYLRKYESKLKNPDLGKHFNELYDTKTLTPRKFWHEMYINAKKELAEHGIEIT
ncbi:MAG: monomethylamine:corrinoid methyltransferase [Candidatus Baldrarchaeia archaeon]